MNKSYVNQLIFKIGNQTHRIHKPIIMIKYLISIIIASILLIACQVEQDELAIKSTELKEKTVLLRTLKSEIDILQEEVEMLSPEKKRDSVMVKVDSIYIQPFVRKVNIQGSVISDETVYAASEVGGRILSVNVKEGQQISRGTLVATIDMETVQLQINEMKTTLDLAMTVYERQKILWDQQIGSEIQYLQAKNNKERLENSLVTMRKQLSKKNIYAPISGVVNKEFASAGEVAGPGTPILEILDSRKIKVKADVPEQYLATIKNGQQVKLSFPALNEELFSKISLIGASINPTNRTFEIEMNLNNVKGMYKPNLLTEIEFIDYTNEEAVVIPLELLQEEVSGRKYVYISKKDNDGRDIAAKAYITLGASYEGSVVIEDGLTAGDLIVTVGGRSLVAGNYLSPNM